MIVNISVFVLIFTLLVLTWILRYIPLRLAIPMILITATALIQPIPGMLGYPVDERFVQGREAIVLGGSGTTLMLKFKGDDQPRLVVISDAQAAQDALKKTKNNQIVFIKFDTKFAGKGKAYGNPNNDGKNPHVRFLGSEEQTMIQKDP